MNDITLLWHEVVMRVCVNVCVVVFVVIPPKNLSNNRVYDGVISAVNEP